MKQYELVAIYRPDAEKQSDQLVKKLTDMLGRDGVTVKSSEVWGKKRFSYPIKKYNEGWYVFMVLQAATPSLLKSVTNNLRNDDGVIRFLTVLKEN